MPALQSIRPALASYARNTPRYQRISLSQFNSLRCNSTTSETASKASAAASEAAAKTSQTAKKGASSFRRFVIGTSLAVTGVLGYVYVTDTRAGVHQYVVVPVIKALFDAEEAHHMGVKALKTLYPLGLHPRERWDPEDKGELTVEVSFADI